MTPEAPGEGMEEMRKRRGWPTPNRMRAAADGLDNLTPARYGEVLRWVADQCDSAPSVPSIEPERLVRALIRAHGWGPMFAPGAAARLIAEYDRLGEEG